MTERPDQTGTPEPSGGSRGIQLLLVAVLGVAVVGFFVGIDDGAPRPETSHRGPSNVVVPAHAAPATAYLDMQRSDLGPNRSWRSDLGRIPRPSADPNQRIIPDLGAREATLSARAQRRAFDGAPPVVPHSVDEMSSDNCLACHQDSVRIGQRTSGLMPHPHLASCQQCHVAALGTGFGLAREQHANAFEGLAAPMSGERAWPGAPPTIPHSTHMREKCLACHGPTGRPGLRTSHPERSSCMQCHAPSATLDQADLAQLWPPRAPTGGPRR